jgi:hypothetical protein
MVFMISPINHLGKEVERPTARVTRLGWERGLAVETGFRRSQENAKKRGAYPKSGARIVGRSYSFIDNDQRYIEKTNTHNK